ncbi:MAG TPA: hypothetical protein VKI20_00995 [Acidimicrobiales bacterium]|nr:hypothetical protein [Acidimicrobiales bacterium]
MRIPSSREEARAGARSLAWARVALGVAAFALPRLPATPWIGKDASRPSSRLLSRALGARDVALGLGALVAVSRDLPVRGWLEAGGLADAGDVAATLLGWESAPVLGRWLVLAAAGGGVVASAVLAPRVDRH